MLLVLPFLSALLLFLSFWTSFGGWLAFVALLPLLFFLKLAEAKKLSTKKIIFFVWLSGLVFLLLELSWILQLKFNLDSFGPHRLSLRPIMQLTWVLMALLLSSGFWLFGLLITRRKNILSSPVLSFLVLPTSWIVAEYGRSWLYMITQWAPNATIGPHWNFGALGYSAITTPLAPVSRIFGLYGLGAIVIIINLLIFYALQKKYRTLWLVPPLFIFVIIGQFVFGGSGNKSIDVQAVQLGENQTVSNPDVIRRAQTAIQIYKPSLVILPEYAFLYEDNINQTVAKIFSNQPLASPGLIVYSRNEYSADEPARRSTQIVYSYKNGHELFTQRKQFLVPSGEYMPVIIKLFMAFFNRAYIEPKYQATRYVKKADKPESIYNLGDVNIGALSCAGVVSPKFYRKLANEGAEVLTNSASLQSFTDAPFYLKQAKQMVMFHAVANAKPFIQSSRAGRSYVIDQNGKTITETKNGAPVILNANIKLNKSRTIYTRIGDIILVISIAVLGWVLIKGRNARS